jgi:GxxExxY protein
MEASVQLSLEQLDAIGKEIVDAAFKIHKALGPGLLESIYKKCMIHELTKRGLRVRWEVDVPIVYDGMRLDSGLRLDLLVEEQVIVELKAVEKMVPVFEAQLLSHLKLAQCRLGFLINFNVPLIRDGIKRMML